MSRNNEHPHHTIHKTKLRKQKGIKSKDSQIKSKKYFFLLKLLKKRLLRTNHGSSTSNSLIWRHNPPGTVAAFIELGTMFRFPASQHHSKPHKDQNKF